MNHLLLAFVSVFIGAALVFAAGLALGSALCNRRWAERCARCQAIIDHSRATPGTILHVRSRHV
jgi:hypothetical protein